MPAKKSNSKKTTKTTVKNTKPKPKAVKKPTPKKKSTPKPATLKQKKVTKTTPKAIVKNTKPTPKSVKKSVPKKEVATKKVIKKTVTKVKVSPKKNITKKTTAKSKPIIKEPLVLEKPKVELSKENKSMQTQIIVGLSIMIVSILALLIAFTIRSIKDRDIERRPTTIVDDTPEDIKKIYKMLSDVNCNGAYTWHFNKSNILKVSEMDENDVLNLIFSKLFQEGYLDFDKITKENYENTAKKVFGENFKIPSKIKNYSYRGYNYTLKEDIISRKINICLDGNEYISNLESYAVEGRVLSLHINVGYISNKKIYNVNGRLVGDYEKTTIKEDLKKATRYIYTFEKEKGIYVLKSVGILS